MKPWARSWTGYAGDYGWRLCLGWRVTRWAGWYWRPIRIRAWFFSVDLFLVYLQGFRFESARRWRNMTSTQIKWTVQEYLRRWMNSRNDRGSQGIVYHDR